MSTNYSDHAAYWDWDGYDDSPTYAFWYKMARKYGKTVLSPMCALAQAGAYMAKRGLSVTAFDYTAEMVTEGMRRFGDIEGLSLLHGDVTDFSIEGAKFDFCFISSGDIHLLSDMSAVMKAFERINAHLRNGGGLGLEVLYPSESSSFFPLTRFDPRVPRTDGVCVWKESESHYDAETRQQHIRQIVHVAEKGDERSFTHELTLQLYKRDELMAALSQCGFALVGEYCDHCFNSSDNCLDNRYIELRCL